MERFYDSISGHFVLSIYRMSLLGLRRGGPLTPISDTVPEDFAHAYGELLKLVNQISRAEVPKGPEEISQEVLDEKVDQWKHADCRGAVTLAEAAIKTLQYELASRGFREGAEAVSEDLVALGRIESVLKPTPLTGDETAQIVEVALPEQLRNARPKARGFRMSELQIIFEPGEAQGPPHGHLSVSHPSRYPTYEELSWAARAHGGPPPNLWMWLPKPEKAQRMHRYTVHLYVLPPEELLG